MGMVIAPALILFMCFIGLLAIGGTVFWIWAIVDIVQNEPAGSNDKVVWLLIVIFLHLLGALIYFFARRHQRVLQNGR